MPKKKNDFHVLAIDTSMSCPGIAIIRVDGKGKPHIVDTGHVKTGSEDSYPVRCKSIESFVHLFIKKHRKRDFDVVVREAFSSRMPKTQYSIFSSWAATDRALADFGYSITEDPVGQSHIKKVLVGRGNKVEKKELAQAVRKLTKYKGEFGTYDESDAVAIGLTWLIDNGYIVGLDDKGAK